MFQNGPQKHAKFTVIILIALFLGMQVLGTLFFARQTKAIVGAPDVVAALTSKWTTDSVLESLLAAGMGALVNASSYFMRKLAYDSAKYISSAASGQKPLVFQEGAGEYFKNVGLDSAASAIDQFGEGLFGTSLCRPPNLRVQAFIQIGLRKIYDDPNTPGPAPRCSWTEFTTSWEQGIDNGFGLKSQFEGVDSVSELFAQSVSVEQSDFGVAIGLQRQIGRHVGETKAGASAERLEGEGFKSLTGLISGKTKTPAQIIKSESETLTASKQGDLTAGQIAGIYGSGMLQVIPSALSVFVNTLVGSLLENLLTDGLFPDSPSGGDAAADQATNPYAAVLNANREAAEKAFSFLITSVPTQLSEFDIVNTYVACPNQGRDAGLNNCVMDDGLRQAVQRSRTGEALTIEEALKEGLLNPNRELISPIREADNTNKQKCWTDAYCYSNIQKLRKVRILPLGFEVAALKSDPDEPWRLGDVVKGFNDCEFNAQGVVIPTPAKPFCRLIDPNWVIKAPLAQCEANVVGPELLNTQSPQRREECVDITTCLATDADGRCVDYGYCTKEENVWKLGGNACQAEFATCKTYSNTKNNELASYLSRTVDFGECTQEAVGCRAYSALKSQAGNWLPSSLHTGAIASQGIGLTIYFNDNITGETCPPDQVGCSAFYPQLPDGSKGAEPFFLKKAPGYLGCYDIDLDASGVQAPQKEADFALLAERPDQCSDFAGICLPSEVNCRDYKPLEDSVPGLTGIIGDNACVSTCVGYDTFKQEESPFEDEEFPLYFIPTQAAECNAQYEGCSEFTNIDAASAGGETKEYYKSLRYCEKPNEDGSNERVYYSWEGSINQGYVLRVHRMLQVDQNAANYVAQLQLKPSILVSEFYPVGAPAYVNDTKTALEENFETCNESNYKMLLETPGQVGAADPDCRALYDEQGNIYHRLLKETVTVDASCHPLRATESNMQEDVQLTSLTAQGATVAGQNLCDFKGGLWGDDPNDSKGATDVCRVCMGGGAYEDGACVYQTISRPGESESCPATANLCRAFSGNAGNNVQNVLFKTFEPFGEDDNALNLAKEGWSSGSIAADAVHVGQRSLQVDSNLVYYTFASSTIKEDGWYELSFWARGTSQSFSINFKQDPNSGTNHTVNAGNFTADPSKANSEALVSIGQEWREYRLGPVQFTGDQDLPVVLHFESVAQNQGTPFFIDNVELKRHEKIHRLRDSWKNENGGNDVPLDCDATPDDGLPGVALGCRAYQDVAANATVYATGFEKLCRPGAAGCEGMFDSKNTIDTADAAFAHIYNARCVGESATTCNLTSGGEILASCEVGIGKSECYIGTKIVVNDVAEIDQTDWATKSTVVIPADDETPIYLTNRGEFGCESRNLGCTNIALEEQTLPAPGQTSAFSFSETRLLNNPQKYEQTLCRADLMGCAEFKSGSNISYFKDPNYSGSTKCEYKESIGPDKLSGWFMQGIGVCLVDIAKLNPGEVGISSGALCKNNDGCGAKESCTGIGEQACYPDYLQVGGTYGLWSNETPAYKGFVGMCPQQQNGCTELVDKADGDKSHYVIFDDALVRQSNQCEGKASLKDGCVLFDRVESPNKLYNTNGTYEKSAAANNELVAPVSDTGNDANVLLKVVRDRECSEWLACRTTVSVRDADNKPVELCYEYKSCRARNENGECAEWVSLEDGAGKRLTENRYVTRGTSWYDEEYSGYSLFNRYPINNYTYVQFDETIETDPLREYLAYEAPGNALAEAGAASCQPETPDGTACGDGGGRCYKGDCIYPIDGPFSPGVSSAADIRAELDYGICKSYPEQDAPYIPAYVLADGASAESKESVGLKRNEFVSRKPNFQRANVLQSGGEACEYQKVEYRDLAVDYWPHSTLSTNIPKGQCVAGDLVGNPCFVDTDCGGAGGLCSQIKQTSSFFGQRGYCLEYDRSRPLGKISINGTLQDTYACLTWLPIQTSASAVDLYNADVNAGYNPEIDARLAGTSQIGGEVYCSSASNSSLREPVSAENPSIKQASYSSLFSSSNSYTSDGLSYASKPDKYNTQGGIGVGGFINIMQTWAYNAVGPNAQLLRLELGGNEDWANKYPSCAVVPHGVFQDGNLFEKCTYLSNVKKEFAKHGVFSFAGFAPNTHHGPSWGTQMHGPRVWNGKKTFAPLVKDIEPIIDIVPPYPNVYWEQASMAHMSPGSTMTHGTFNNVLGVKFDGVYRSQYEEDLNEYDLNTVHFVPTGFPSGSFGLNPGLLTRQFSIDFNFLREQDGPFAYLNTAERAGQNKQFVEPSVADEAIVWAYKLEAGKGAGLLSHTDYEDMYTDVVASIPGDFKALASDERNTIARRYVALITYNPTANPSNTKCQNTPQFLTDVGLGACGVSPKFGTTADNGGNGIKPPSASNDPFTAPCPNDTNKNSYLAIGMDFNENGEFLGYISKFCHSEGHRGGINFATVATLNNVCSEFTQVYEPSSILTGTSNKAWTERLWDKSTYELAAYKKAFQRNQPTPPFGSLKIGTVDLADYWKLRRYSFLDANLDGVPFLCGSVMPGGGFIGDIDDDHNCYGLGQTKVKYSTDLVNAVSDISWVAVSETALSNLFALSFERINYSDVTENGLQYNKQPKIDKSVEIEEVRGPQIFAINPYNCTPGTGRTCTAGDANNITVNRRNYTTLDYDNNGQPDEDKDLNGVVDPIIGKGFYTAVTNFFAFADDNQMPIRRVMVDWGDGNITNAGKKGLYKNRKPFCALENTQPKRCVNPELVNSEVEDSSGLTCMNDTECQTALGNSYFCSDMEEPQFGDASRACVPGYFEFVHQYVCGAEELADSSIAVQVVSLPTAIKDKVLAQGYGNGDLVCSYKPKVQVLDNWGWCNGTDATGNYKKFYADGVSNYCDHTRQTQPFYPWTEYKGQIIVLPVQ